MTGLTIVSRGEFCTALLGIWSGARRRAAATASSAPARYRRFVVAAAQLAGTYGGSMSGEHGDGRARSELLPAMYSAEAIEVMAAVKAIFDPGNTLNPGVLVDPVPLDADLRVPQARPLARGLGFAYSHDGGDLSAAVHRCVGVGKCRADTTGSGGVMCPSWLATRDEKDSTRGRARVLQELANGSLVHGFAAAELAESLDLCLSCKGCSSDCPAGVDMATYKAEVLYQRYRRRPRPPAHYSLGWLPRWARLASRAPGLANAALRAPLPSIAWRVARPSKRPPAVVEETKRIPRTASASMTPSVGRRDRGASDAEEKILTLEKELFADVRKRAAGHAQRIRAQPRELLNLFAEDRDDVGEEVVKRRVRVA